MPEYLYVTLANIKDAANNTKKTLHQKMRGSLSKTTINLKSSLLGIRHGRILLVIIPPSQLNKGSLCSRMNIFF